MLLGSDIGAPSSAATALDALGVRRCGFWDRLLRVLGFSRSCVDLQKFGIGAAPTPRRRRRSAHGRRRRRRRG